MGRREGFPHLALLVHAAFALPIKLPLAPPTRFLTYTLRILSPTPLGESE